MRVETYLTLPLVLALLIVAGCEPAGDTGGLTEPLSAERGLVSHATLDDSPLKVGDARRDVLEPRLEGLAAASPEVAPEPETTPEPVVTPEPESPTPAALVSMDVTADDDDSAGSLDVAEGSSAPDADAATDDEPADTDPATDAAGEPPAAEPAVGDGAAVLTDEQPSDDAPGDAPADAPPTGDDPVSAEPTADGASDPFAGATGAPTTPDMEPASATPDPAEQPAPVRPIPSCAVRP